MPINYDYAPKPTLKAGFFGLEGRGKTHGMCTLAVAACRVLSLPGDIVCLATENWVDDWHERLSKATGRRVAPAFTSDPTEGLDFLRECEATQTVSLILIDSMTELQIAPRKRWMAKNNKPIPLNEYSRIDQPFAMLSDALKASKKHWIATMRESDDNQEVDGTEITVGKKAKAGDFAYVPRLKVHCTLARGKQGTTHVWDVSDSHANKRSRYVDGTSECWTPHLEWLR